MTRKSRKLSGQRQGLLALLVVIGAWLVPGLGHLLLRRWGRGIAFLLCVGGLAVAGYLMRGVAFPAHANDLFDRLGFLADIGSGLFYFLAKIFEPSGADIAMAAGNYGTRFIATAGVLNLLCVIDAWEMVNHRRD